MQYIRIDDDTYIQFDEETKLSKTIVKSEKEQSLLENRLELEKATQGTPCPTCGHLYENPKEISRLNLATAELEELLAKLN